MTDTDYTFPESIEHPAETIRRDAIDAAYRAVGGLHPRCIGSRWCEAGNCWKRVKTQDMLATAGLVRFGRPEDDGGMWRLCPAHRRVIEPTSR